MKIILLIFLLLPLFANSQIKYISDEIITSLKGTIISEKEKNDTVTIQVNIPYNIEIIKSQISYIYNKNNLDLVIDWTYLNDKYYCELKKNKEIIKIIFMPDKKMLQIVFV